MMYCWARARARSSLRPRRATFPFIGLPAGSLVQLGWGARQRRILTAETDRTSAIAESIAHDKELTRQLLRTIGVPVPEGRPVSDTDDAWEAAQEIGLPVVVKPRDSNHGRGVFTGLTTREQVAAAFAYADGIGSGVLVERFAPGWSIACWSSTTTSSRHRAASRP